jgi:hypothetical protein
VAKYQTKAFNNVKPIVLPDDASPEYVSIDIEYNAGTTASPAYAVNDLIQLCTLPIGHKVLDWTFIPADVDSNGAPVIAFSLGVENTGGTDLGTEIWATGLTSGTSALTRNTTNISAQGDVTTVRNIDLKCTVAAATYAGSGKIGQLLMLVQN